MLSFGLDFVSLSAPLIASLLLSAITARRRLRAHQDKVVAQALVLGEFDLLRHGAGGDARSSIGGGRSKRERIRGGRGRSCCKLLLSACSLRGAAAWAHHAWRASEREREATRGQRADAGKKRERTECVCERREKREREIFSSTRPGLDLFFTSSSLFLALLPSGPRAGGADNARSARVAPSRLLSKHHIQSRDSSFCFD